MRADKDCLSVHLGQWYLSVYWDPRRWGIEFHRNAQCCRWWLLVGPFEINRVWSAYDEDIYYRYFPELRDDE